MWILVMTVLGSYPNAAASVTTHEFSSNQTCVDAGNDWARRVFERNKHYTIIAKCYKK